MKNGPRGRSGLTAVAARHDAANTRKIAVVRANALGDYVFAVPALDALRAKYPTTEIVLLAQPWHADFLRGRPGPVNRVESIPPCPGVSTQPNSSADEERLEAFFDRMRQEHFDIAIQLHGGGRYSNPFTRRLGARTTIGLRAPDAPPLDLWIPYVYLQPEVFRYLEVVGLLGAAPLGLEPHITVTASERAAARPHCPTRRPMVVLHPGATDPRRRWPPEKFAALGDRLSLAGAHVAVTGVDRERPLVHAVLSAMRRPAVDLCGRLTLGELAALLQAADVVIANDTGPLHLARAVGAATVGVYWCGNLTIAGPVTRERHRVAVSWRLHCPVCGQNTLERRCEHSTSFVSEITVDEVCDNVLALLDEANR